MDVITFMLINNISLLREYTILGFFGSDLKLGHNGLSPSLMHYAFGLIFAVKGLFFQ